MIGGIATVIAGFMQIKWLVFVVFITMSVIPTAYSYILYKKGI